MTFRKEAVLDPISYFPNKEVIMLHMDLKKQ
jgi:hypothetical protein